MNKADSSTNYQVDELSSALSVLYKLKCNDQNVTEHLWFMDSKMRLDQDQIVTKPLRALPQIDTSCLTCNNHAVFDTDFIMKTFAQVLQMNFPATAGEMWQGVIKALPIESKTGLGELWTI